MAEEPVSTMLVSANLRPQSMGGPAVAAHPLISLASDASAMTAFHAALELDRRGWISLLTSAVIDNLVMHTPDALRPVRHPGSNPRRHDGIPPLRSAR
eukprot:144767-Prymnesium_polylepis.2